MTRLSFVVATTALLALGCSEDLSPVVRRQVEASAGFEQQLVAARAKLQAQKARAGALVVAEADVEGASAKARLDEALAGAEQALAGARERLATAGGKVDAAVRKGKLPEATAVAEAGEADVTSALAGLTATLATIDGLVAEQERTAEARARRVVERTTSEAPPTVDASKKGEADYSALDFKAGTVELDLERPGVRANLDALLALLNACPELTIELEAHTSSQGDAKENRALSNLRAQTLAWHLTSVGKVKGSKLEKVVGLGSARPLVEEPAPGSDAERATSPEVLAQLRARNERIRVRVVTPCR